MKFSKNHLMILTLLTFLFLFTSPFSAHGATTDSQELSFAVSPLPFWEFNNNDTTHVHYRDNVVSVNNSPYYTTDYDDDYSRLTENMGILAGSLYQGSYTSTFGDDFTYLGYISQYDGDDQLITVTFTLNVPANSTFLELTHIERATFYDTGLAKLLVYDINTDSYDTLRVFTSTMTEYNDELDVADYLDSNGDVDFRFEVVYSHPTVQTRLYIDFIKLDYEFPYLIYNEPENDDLEILVPIQPYKDIKIKTMVDISSFNDSVILSLANDGINSGFDFEIDSSLSKVYFGDNELSISSYDVLRLEISLTYSINVYSVKILDENSTTITTLYKYYGVDKINNKFTFNFDIIGNINIYYLSGDISYSSYWGKSIDDDDCSIYSTNYNYLYAEPDNGESLDVSHEIYVSGFQFWRSQWTSFISWSSWNDGDDFTVGQTFTLEFFDTNGLPLYTVSFELYMFFDVAPNDEVWSEATITVYNETSESDLFSVETYRNYDSLSASDSYTLEAKTGVWRDQENKINIKYLSQDGFFGDGSVGKLISSEDFDYFVIDDKLENYQCKMTSRFRVIDISGLSNQLVNLEFNAFEYAYNSLDGVVEPHFSTTWWEGIPIIGAIINGFIWVGNIIVGGLSSAFSVIVGGLVGLFTPLITAVISAVTSLASGIWGLFSATLGSIYSALSGLASGIWGLFSATLGSIYDGIASVVSGIVTWVYTAITNIIDFLIDGALLDLIMGFVTWLLDAMINILDAVGTWLGIGAIGTSITTFFSSFLTAITGTITFLSSVFASGVAMFSIAMGYIAYYLPLALTFAVGMVAYDIVDIFLTSEFERFEKYWNFLFTMFDIMFNVANSLIQFIGGLSP